MISALNIFRFVSSHPLTCGNRLKAVGRVFAWQIRSSLQSEVIVSWIGEQKLAVKRGMTGATGNVYVGLHEFYDMMFLLHFLRSGDLFLDIGANIGAYTVLASGVCRSETWAFEPDPASVAALRRNIELNLLHKLVTVHEVALGANEGDVSFTIGRDTTNRVTNEDKTNCRVVPQMKLDSVLKDARPIFAKLDVEVYEEEVLRAGTRLVINDSLQAIELETVTPFIEETLSAHRFCRSYYNPFKRALSRDSIGVQTCNALFVRDFDFVNSRVKSAEKICVLGFAI